MSGKAAQNAGGAPKDNATASEAAKRQMAGQEAAENAAAGNGGSGEESKPSAVLIDALGDHAEQQGLTQQEGESEIEFAVRAIEALGGLIVSMDGKIEPLASERDELAEDFRKGMVTILSAIDPGAEIAPLSEDELAADHAKRMQTEAVVAAYALREERDALKRQLSSQKGAATKARAKIEEMKEAAKPRKLGPIEVGKDEKPLSMDELKLAIDCAEEVVLAFSDGKAEIRGIKPRKVAAGCFKMVRGRLLFDRPDLSVTGPGGEGAGTPQLAGVALLLDGEQFAWSPLSQAIDLGAGQTFNLAGSVIFG